MGSLAVLLLAERAR